MIEVRATAQAAQAAFCDAVIQVAPLGVRDPLANPIFEQALAKNYLIFDAYVSGERRVDLHPIVLTPQQHAEAVR